MAGLGFKPRLARPQLSWQPPHKIVIKKLFIYLFICSLWLLGCTIFWGHLCATDAVPSVTSQLVLILPTSEK